MAQWTNGRVTSLSSWFIAGSNPVCASHAHEEKWLTRRPLKAEIAGSKPVVSTRWFASLLDIANIWHGIRGALPAVE